MSALRIPSRKFGDRPRERYLRIKPNFGAMHKKRRGPQTNCSVSHRAKNPSRKVGPAMHGENAFAASRPALKICNASSETAIGIVHAVLKARNRGQGPFAGLIVAFVHDKVHPACAAPERPIRQRAEDTGIVLGDNAVDDRWVCGVCEADCIFGVVHV